jgi:hypothetical protein
VEKLTSRLSQLNIDRINASAGSGATLLSEKDVQLYIERIRETLEAGDPQTRKTVLRSFIERIQLDGDHVQVEYHLPHAGPGIPEPTVLPIVPAGGAGGIRTLCLQFAKP